MSKAWKGGGAAAGAFFPVRPSETAPVALLKLGYVRGMLLVGVSADL
jgi:hypothetical protein